MDYVVGFPRMVKGNHSIWGIVDCLTKMSYFFFNQEYAHYGSNDGYLHEQNRAAA